MSYRFPLSYTPIDEQAIGTVLRRYAGVQHAELITDFEKEISRITGVRYVAAVNSGTAAIHLALKALNVSSGDKVATSTFTYVASVNPILYQGAIPILIDSESDTWNMDPELLETALKENEPVKAIVVVHGYGVPAKMDDILTLSRKYNVPVIEDAAEALGSTYREKHLGTLADIGVLSFNNNKIITTYGGGAVLTNDEAIHKRVVHWASQSRENKPYYEHLELGYNYRMSPLNAACGVAYLNKLPALLQGKREILNRYRNELAKCQEITFPIDSSSASPNHWLTTILVDSRGKTVFDGDSIVKQLANGGIETRRLWNPMHVQPLYTNAQFYSSGTSENLFKKGLCLPSGKELSSDDISIISTALIDALRV